MGRHRAQGTSHRIVVGVHDALERVGLGRRHFFGERIAGPVRSDTALTIKIILDCDLLALL